MDFRDKKRYKIDKETEFEKLHDNVLTENFDDFSKCEDSWLVTEFTEIERVFKSLRNVSEQMRNKDKVEYCSEKNVYDLLESGHVIYSPYYIYRIKTKDRKCPVCGANIPAFSEALSRRDNETYICSECGLSEAINDFSLDEKS